MTTFLAWATDSALRRAASSGGFIRAMLAHLLATHTVDAALVARTGPPEGGFRPRFHATPDPAELADRRTASVYYPVDPWAVPLDPRLRYAATLLPCQVEQLRRGQARGRYRNVVLVFELLCNYTPRPQWTAAVCRRVNVARPARVAYRGNGWPGEIAVDDRSLPFCPQWSNDAAQWGLPRCRSCRRTWGASDWVAADPWGIDADMGDGKTLVRASTAAGRALACDAVEAGRIAVEPLGDDLFDLRGIRHQQRRD